MTEPLFQAGDPFNDEGVCLSQDAADAYGTKIDSIPNASTGKFANCVSNDVRVATTTLISYDLHDGNGEQVYTGGAVACDQGSTISVRVAAQLEETANSARSDIGVWVATDGGFARGGTCNHYNLVAPALNTTVNGITNVDGDQCGDMEAGAITPVGQLELGLFDTICNALPASPTTLHIGSCLAWSVPGQNFQCPIGGPALQTPEAYRFGTAPNASSKCNCEGFDLPITVRQTAKLEIRKVCTPTTDNGTFDLKIDGSTTVNSVVVGEDKACGTGTGAQTLGAGTNTVPGAVHTFAEDGFTTANYTSTWACTNRSASGPQHTPFNGTGDGPENITLLPNEDVICTFTNVRKPTLTVRKRITNDAGGTAVVAAFGITTNAGSLTFDGGVADPAPNTTLYTSNTILLNAPGTFTLAENDVTGYAEGTWQCTGVAGAVVPAFGAGSVVIAAGEQAVCTITNDDQAVSLTLRKIIVNDHGGTIVTATPFGIVTNAGTPAFNCNTVGNTTTCTSQAMSTSAGLKTFSESDVAGYTEGTWSCSPVAATGTAFGAGSVTLANGQSTTCEITNNDDPASLTLRKIIVNDQGGTVVTATPFGIVTNAGTPAFNCNTVGNTTTCTSQAMSTSAGLKTFSEIDVTGYAEGNWSCSPVAATGTAFGAGSVTLANGASTTCEITNDDAPASLTLRKIIVNDHGGTIVTATPFSIVTNAGTPAFNCNTVGNTTTCTSQAMATSAGLKTFSEGNVAGYTEGTWSCSPVAATGTAFGAGSVTLANGQSTTCEITNDDDPASLTLRKIIVNDHGGTVVTATPFGIVTNAGTPAFNCNTVGNTTTCTSQAMSTSAGLKTFSEANVTGYTEGTWSCAPVAATGTAFGAGSVTLANGQSTTCEITNDDDAAQLTLRKIIINDQGGTIVTATPFGIVTNAGTPAFNCNTVGNTTTCTSQAMSTSAGLKTFSESDVTGYGEGTWSCSPVAATGTAFGAGSVTLANGQSTTCEITNTDDPAQLTLKKIIVNDDGGTAVTATPFGIVTNAGTPIFNCNTVGNTTTCTSQAMSTSAGLKTFSEADVAGYTEGTWSCSPVAVTGTAFGAGSVTLANGQSTTCEITNNDIAAPGATLLIIDEDGIDNGLHYNESGGPITPQGPQFFSPWDVNDDKPSHTMRDVLRYFAANVNRTITVRTGQTGDEAWFAPNCIPQKWISGGSNTCLTGSQRSAAINSYFLGAVPPQDKLDKIPAVMPLRALGLNALVGKNVCAVVYDSDISINYNSSRFPFTDGNLQGETLGIVAFRVNETRTLNGFSSSTLPEVQITILNTNICSSLQLFNAPVPRSSSEPNDRVAPGSPAGYRALLTQAGFSLFY